MFFFWLIKLFFVLCCTANSNTNNVCKNYEAYFNISSSQDCYYMSDNEATVPEIITKYIGVHEVHEVTTEDGYILTLFRLPQENPKDVILFQHGVATDSSFWVAQYNESIALLFWRAGYEVWLGNSRGTFYSKKHIDLSRYEEDFWNFSFHEIGYYDLHANIEYVKVKTKMSKIIYVGFSMGVTSSLVYASLRPHDAETSVKLMIALAPVSFLKYVTSPMQHIFYFSKVVMQYKLNTFLKWYSLLPHEGLLLKVFRKINNILPYKKIVVFGISLLCGNSNATDPRFINIMVNKLGSEVSIKTVAHYIQIITAGGNFRMYDYGIDNLKHYGQTEPPSYPLENMSVPIFTVYSDTDTVSHPEDVELLYNKLPDKVKVYGKLKVDNFNHNDFFFASDRNDKVYNVVLNVLAKLSL